MVRRQGRWRRVTADEKRAGLRSQALVDDVVGLEPQLAPHPDVRPDFEPAVSRYRAAEGALEQVATPAEAGEAAAAGMSAATTGVDGGPAASETVNDTAARGGSW